MQEATEATVLGDFEDASFTHFGVVSTFFRREGKFIVRTDGPDGKLRDFEIAFTFGVDPLQQYLIELPGGRLQALGVAWDIGGKRWFHLYPDEAIPYDDELHWTGPNHNWNYMCAECHSTNLQKNYSVEQDRYETTWSEIDVSCEACHGPASAHVDWTRNKTPGDAMGLVVRLGDLDGAAWIMDPATGLAQRSRPRTSRAEIETCARCHSRRGAFAEDYVHGRPLLDTHRLALLDEPLYYPDGQIRDEVYVYGSFLQSLMYRKGVTCSDCHDAHSGRVLVTGNELCAGCHLPEKFDTPSHHFHDPDLPGGECIACHMPERNYMVVDPRRDHSIRVPRPDLTVKLGVPNACNGCHEDESAEWAAGIWAERYGKPEPHYGEAFDAAQKSLPGAAAAIARVATDLTLAGLVRASALEWTGRLPGGAQEAILRQGAQDGDPLVRLAALGALESFPPQARVELAAPRLQDPVRSVRLEAARVLAAVSPQVLTPEQRAAHGAALEEYRRAEEFNADRPESHVNLGLIHAQRDNPIKAEAAYRTGLRIDPSYVPAHVNLADLYRMQGREEEAGQVLRDALQIAPENGDLHHALGLALVRQSRLEEALASLERAAELRPDEQRYSFVLGVALHDTGRNERALEVLEVAHRRHPSQREILVALVNYHRDSGSPQRALVHARTLLRLAPGDAAAQRLVKELETLQNGAN